MAVAKFLADRNADAAVRMFEKLKKMNSSLAWSRSQLLALIEQSLEYARGNGFSPMSAVPKLLPIFGDVDSTACQEAFVFGGPEGKPYFIRGPHDAPERIVQLHR